MFVVDVPTLTTWCSPDETNWRSHTIAMPSEQQHAHAAHSLKRVFQAASIPASHAARSAAVIAPTSRTRIVAVARHAVSSTVSRKRARQPYVPFHASEPGGALEMVSVRGSSNSRVNRPSQRRPNRRLDSKQDTRHHSRVTNSQTGRTVACHGSRRLGSISSGSGFRRPGIRPPSGKPLAGRRVTTSQSLLSGSSLVPPSGSYSAKYRIRYSEGGRLR